VRAQAVKQQPELADPLQVTMALPLPDLAAGDRAAARTRLGPDRTEHVVVVAALLVLVGPVAHAEGGRDAGAACWLALVTIAALAVTRPWERLAGRRWLLAPAVALAALFVLPATGVGRGGAVAALSYALVAGLLLAVTAYARTPARRAAVAALLCVGGVAQFGWALVPWWGSEDPTHPMVGTYFSHNQLAVALLLPALLGAALAVVGSRPWRSAGAVAAPLCAAGVVLSTSRATLACLVVGWVVVVVLALLVAGGRRQAVLRAVAVTAVAVVLTVVLPGPPLFSSWQSPLGGAAARAAVGETVDANTTYRTEFWREALSVTRAHPLTGAGYGRLATESAPLVPTSWARSPLAHSGPLQAFADGGVLLGLTVLAGLGLVVAGLLRRLATLRGLRKARARDPVGADTALVLAASVAGLALLAHALVDTDWSYPALAAQLAVVLGLALAARPVDPVAVAAPQRDLVAATGSAVLVLVLAVGAVGAWGQSFHISAPAQGPANQTATGEVHP
jgi:O-antigen ligase